MQQVEIRVEGRIDKTWSEWFEGFTLTYTEQHETLLNGVVPDQAALYGMITKLRDLGLTLVSVIPKDMDAG
ncbi:MAG: hypothetical protein IMY76_06140 [Chloroflexi bacterium]|nr:hypothetical protein [Chloroflexota bacterium]